MYDNDFSEINELDDDYICHWGVKGMKWKDHVYKVEDAAKSGYKTTKKAAKAAYKSIKKKVSRLFETKAQKKARLAKERFNKAKKAGKAQAEAERNAQIAANVRGKRAASRIKGEQAKAIQRIKGEQAAQRIRNKQSAERRRISSTAGHNISKLVYNTADARNSLVNDYGKALKSYQQQKINNKKKDAYKRHEDRLAEQWYATHWNGQGPRPRWKRGRR